MTPDLARQELVTWTKRQEEALPNDYADWAYGKLCVLRDLRAFIDDLFGPENGNDRTRRIAR